MVKFFEQKQPTLEQYANMVADSIRYLRKFTANTTEAITEGTINTECLRYGCTWKYDHRLKACVNTKESYWNSLMSIRESELTVNTSSTKKVPDVDPFRGTWGTPISSDSQIDTQSDNAQTVKGTDTNTIGRQQTPETRPIEKRTLRLKL